MSFRPNVGIRGSSTDDLAPAYKAALDSLRDPLMAMPESEVLRDLRLAAGVSVAIVEGNARKLVPCRAAIVAQFGEPAGKRVDALLVIALATSQADVELARAQPSGDLSEAHDALGQWYRRMLADAESLVYRKVIDARDLEPAREIKGYLAIIESTRVLVSLLREKERVIAGQTPLTREEIDEAERAAARLATALVMRDQGVTLAPAATPAAGPTGPMDPTAPGGPFSPGSN